MVIPHLIMHSVQGKIGMRSSKGKLKIYYSNADLSIQQPKAELKIKKTSSKLYIDQTQAWNNLNLKSAFVRIRDMSNMGRQAVLEGIKRRVDQGDTLMKIENKGNPIKSQAIENSQSQGGYDTGHVPPTDAVKIQYQPTQLDIQWHIHQPDIKVTTHKPQYHYQPGELNIYVRQYPSLTINMAGNQVNMRV